MLIRGVLAALLLLAAAPLWAQAPTQVWSGTLTVKDLGTVRGCDDAQTANANKCESASSGALSDDDFTHGGGTYDIKTISLAEGSAPNALTLVLSQSLDAAGQQFVLVVGNQRFNFSDATISTANSIAASQVVWSSGPALWNASASVSLALYTSGSPITISPSPIALTEGGGAVTLTVTMNVAPTASVTWTHSLTGKVRDKATVTPSSRTFTTSNWATPQTFTITPADDADADDESGSFTLLSTTTTDGFYRISRGTSVRITDDELSPDAFLSALSLLGGTLSPAFTGSTTAYTAEVPNGQASVTVTPTPRDSRASGITVDGTAITIGSASGTIALDPETPKAIVVVVTAEDTTTTRTYTITVTRAGDLPTGVELTFPDALKVVNEATTTNTPSGTITASLVGGSFSELVTCSVVYPAADRAGITATGGFPTPADPDYNLVGNFLIPAKATDSTNGATIQVLADTTVEEPEVGAIAATCTAEGVTLTSEFETFTILDNDTAPGRVSNLRLTAAYQSLEASWEPPAGAETRGPVVEGYNVRYKLGEAPDQAATANDPTTGWVSHTTIYAATARTATIANDLTNFEVYDVQVRTTNEGGMGDWVSARGTPVAAKDATLSDLILTFPVVNTATYMPTFPFSPNRLNYALTVPQDITEVTLTPTPSDTSVRVRVTVDGSAVTSGQASAPISLTEGSDKVIPIVVTAEDVSVKRTYTVTITRAGAPTTLNLSAPNAVPVSEGGEIALEVRQGSTVTITATLSAPAQRSGVAVSFTVGHLAHDSRNTALAGAFTTTPPRDPDTNDVSITIPWGALSGTIDLTVAPDADTEEENNTIVIGAAVTSPSLIALNMVITIVPDLRVPQVSETVLPEVARAVAGRATGAISARIDQVMTGGARAQASLGGQGTVAGALVAHAPDMVNGHRPWRHLLDGSNFVLPLNGDGGAGGSSLSMWGSGEYRNLSGESEGVEFDGNLLGAQIGVDAKLRDDLLAGAALSWSQGSLDYEDSGGAGQTTRGDYEVDILGIHPYIGWHSGHNNFWATAGYGSGEVEISPDDGEAVSSDVSLWSVGAGGGGQVWRDGNSDIRLKAEVMSTEMTVDENAEMPESLTVNATLLRVAMQASRTEHLLGGGSRSPSLSLGVRHDGGDGNTGTGAEVGGSVRYDNPQTRVSASASVNLLVGRSDYEEWGISGMLRLSPGADGQGLSFILRPGYGGNAEASVGDTSRIWSQSMRDAADTTQNFDPQGRLEARLGYGLSASGERGGLLTPWGGMNLQNDARRYRVGLDWTSGGPLTMRLHGERREQTNSDASHAVVLKGEMRF